MGASGAGAESAPPPAANKAASVVQEAAGILGCTSEACVLSHPAFREHAFRVSNLNGQAIRDELATRFKPAGPRLEAKPLNNFDIDGIMQQWAREFNFFSTIRSPWATSWWMARRTSLG